MKPTETGIYTAEGACEHLRLTADEVAQALATQSDPGGDCVHWVGDRGGRGYGQLVTRWGGERRRVAAHRLSYLVNNGPIPSGLHVLHICDNRICVNPDHLVVGSHTANMQDMKRKGRSMSGCASPRAKLTEGEVGLIRALGRVGAPHKQLAAQFGVSRSTVTKVINGTAYQERV